MRREPCLSIGCGAGSYATAPAPEAGLVAEATGSVTDAYPAQAVTEHQPTLAKAIGRSGLRGKPSKCAEFA